MPNDLSYDECYSLLHIQPGASFEEARKNYKRVAQRNHPDRFHNEPVQAEQAKQVLMQTMQAFRIIEEYYNLYGGMPHDKDFEQSTNTQASAAKNSAEDDLLAKTSGLSTKRGKASSKSARPSKSSTSTRSTFKKSKSQRRAKSSATSTPKPKFFVWLIVIISIIAYLSFLPEESVEQNNTRSYSNTQSSERASQSITQNAQELSEDNKSAMKQEAFNKKLQNAYTVTQKQLLKSTTGDTFTFGSSFALVSEIHGPPDRSDGDVWYYGESKIVFKNGQVHDWKSDPSYPLATRLK